MERSVPVLETESRQDRRRHRIGETARSAATQDLTDELGQLPRGEAGLLRLRVDGDDAARPVPDEVDHRVRHLLRATERLEFPEEDHLVAGAELAAAPRLVEEGHS